MLSQQNEVRRLLADLFPDRDKVRGTCTTSQLQHFYAANTDDNLTSQGLLDAHVATVGEVQEAVAFAGAGQADGSSAAHAPASPRGRTNARMPSSSSSDFIVLGDDSDSDFVVHEEAASKQGAA